MALTAVLPYAVAAMFFLAAGTHLARHIHKSDLSALRPLYPISGYLFGIAGWFVFMGVFQLVSSPVLPLLASLAVVVGAAYMARFVFKIVMPDYDRQGFILLLGGALVLIGRAFLAGDMSVVIRTAHLYAFVVAGVFTTGYMLVNSITIHLDEGKVSGIGVSTSLGLCCVFGHGLMVYPLISVISVPFLGLQLPAPMVFAALSPVSLLFVIALIRFIPVPGKQR